MKKLQKETELDHGHLCEYRDENDQVCCYEFSVGALKKTMVRSYLSQDLWPRISVAGLCHLICFPEAKIIQCLCFTEGQG